MENHHTTSSFRQTKTDGFGEITKVKLEKIRAQSTVLYTQAKISLFTEY